MQWTADERAGLPARSLIRSADSLLVSTGASAVLGAVFWVAAARLFSADELGRDAALIAAMVELSTICQLNLDNVLVRQLPRVGGGAARYVARAYALNTLLALVLGTAFVLVAPSVTGELAFLHDDPIVGAAFVVGLALWGVFTLQDSTLTALRHAQWVPVETSPSGCSRSPPCPWRSRSRAVTASPRVDRPDGDPAPPREPVRLPARDAAAPSGERRRRSSAPPGSASSSRRTTSGRS